MKNPDAEMDAPEVAAAESEPMGGGEDCIPTDALAMPDEKEQMQPPEVGDEVNYQVTGTVTRIEGDNAYVKRKTVNGQEVAAPESPKDEYAELESAAAQQPME